MKPERRVVEKEDNYKPLVSIFLATYNRPGWFKRALESCIQQDYENIEIIVCNDGGCDVDITDYLSIYNKPGDSKIMYFRNCANKGLAHCYNRMLEMASGEFICYIGDDDFYYPHHVKTLVNLSDSYPKYGVYYSDLYQTHYEGDADEHHVLLKNITCSRDYDRYAMFQYNIVLSMQAMHRKSCVEQVGGYLDVPGLVDWGIHRRLAHVTDFKHTPTITGEYWANISYEKQDRISKKVRINQDEVLGICEIIRNDRPPKPWIVPDLGINIIGGNGARLAKEIKCSTVWPFRVYHNEGDDNIDADIIARVFDNIAIPPEEVAWVEKAVQPIIDKKGDCFEIPKFGGSVYRKGKSGCPNVSPSKYWPLRFEHLMSDAERFYEKGAFQTAFSLFQDVMIRYKNIYYIKSWMAQCTFALGQWETTIGLLWGLNAVRATPQTLELQAKCHDQLGELTASIDCRARARRIMSIKCPGDF